MDDAAVAHLLWPQLGLAHLLEPVLRSQAVQHCLVHLDEEEAVNHRLSRKIDWPMWWPSLAAVIIENYNVAAEPTRAESTF